MYVAASRQRDTLQIGEGTKGYFPKLDSGRIYRKYRNNIRLEIGKTNDYDELSLVNKNFYESKKMVSGIQEELIRLSDPSLPIPKLQAVRLSEQANFAFEVRLKSYNKYEGLGTYTYANGDIYIGEWKKKEFNAPDKLNERHGKGTYTYANGDQYTGEWKKGLRHGKGVFTHANGKVEEGLWKKDRLAKPIK